MSRRTIMIRAARVPSGAARLLPVFLIALASSASACATSRPYQWVESVPESPRAQDGEYRVATGDVLSVRVWNQDSMSTARTKVREDGRISVPFLQDVAVSGMTPAELARDLKVMLKPFIVTPVVTVSLEERAPLRVSVLGEVAKPGMYDLQDGAGVLQALAAAGGLSPYAARDGIYVLRTRYEPGGNRAPARIRFRYTALAGGMVPAATFRLRRDDVIVVEK